MPRDRKNKNIDNLGGVKAGTPPSSSADQPILLRAQSAELDGSNAKTPLGIVLKDAKLSSDAFTRERNSRLAKKILHLEERNTRKLSKLKKDPPTEKKGIET